jgi:hypothetical protein
MTGQPWLAAAFAGIMIVTAAYCLTRLGLSWRGRRPTDRPVDAVHLFMGVAMAGMLVPDLRVLWIGGWEVVFGVGGIVFLWRVARELALRHRARSAHGPAHDGQHLLGCGAMLYMLAATTSGSAAGSAAGSAVGRGVAADAMSGSAGLPTFALILAVALLGSVVWTADKISTMAPVAALAAAAGSLDGGASALPGTARGLAATSAVAMTADPRRGATPPSRGAGVPLSPRLAACCEIAMGVTMGYMLIVLL